jgi:hypothetical protein
MQDEPEVKNAGLIHQSNKSITHQVPENFTKNTKFTIFIQLQDGCK